MDWARLALDYIDTLVWPLAAVGLLVFFLLRFSENIALLIDRIQGARGPGGFEISSPVRPSDQSPIDPSGGGIAPDALTGAMQDLAARYGDVVAELSQTAANATQVERAYQLVYVLYQFERIYRIIFGTQLLFMRNLAASPDLSLSEAYLPPVFDEHVRRASGVVPTYKPTQETFVSFLTSSEMITFDDQTRNYQLTDWGSAFLNYIAQQGLQELSYSKVY